MTDYPFYKGFPPHERHSDTSRAAAGSILSASKSMRARVYRMIVERGEFGVTDDEIESALGLRHQTASARRRELVIAKLIEDSGRTRATRSGRKATVWVLIPQEPQGSLF